MHTSNGFDSEGETMVKTRLVRTYERIFPVYRLKAF